MSDKLFGLTEEGVKTALDIKTRYKKREPLVVPSDGDKFLAPENFLNSTIDLGGLEDPLPLALVSARDPEAPMALAAVARLSPLGRKTRLISGMFEIVGDITKHEAVKNAISLITESAFDPNAIAKLRRETSRFIVRTRAEYTTALRQNLHNLMDGSVSPRYFVQEFFQLTEAGNMRNDIRKKLVISLLMSETVRPSVKFLMLENFHEMPAPVQTAIIQALLRADSSRHVDLMKEELRWIVAQGVEYSRAH
jgi:hypothetical protein|tara:strand:- start:84211 stop:84963 length:753 start_codon:yes stop_codon:yes gene_type:complete